jgi:ABC-type uncharacterized transport system auxiliary subunit
MTLRLKSGALVAGLLASALLTSGCGPLISFGDDGPADTVYSLKYAGGFRDAAEGGAIIYVDEPHMADGLAGQKITVALANDRRSTLKGARWAAPLSVMIRDYEIRALGDQVGVHMIGEGGLDIHAGCRLGTKVWTFEFAPGGSVADDRVNLAIELSLVRLKDSQLLSHPTITKSHTVDASGDDAVASAFNAVMRDAANDMGAWLKAQAPSCAP